MKEYYSKRANEFEQSYYRADPTRQAELEEISNQIQQLFRGEDVLEIACGTGYWSERTAVTAKSNVGVDITEETLEIARSKNIKTATFKIGNAY